MHRTLKEETVVQENERAQQRGMGTFRWEYNEERPHEALGMRTPSDCYTPSPRPYPGRVREPEYDSGLTVRRISGGGQFSWQHEEVFLSEVLRGERIALQPIDERSYRVYFATVALAVFDSRKRRIERLPAHHPPLRLQLLLVKRSEPKNPDPNCKVCARSNV